MNGSKIIKSKSKSTKEMKRSMKAVRLSCK